MINDLDLLGIETVVMERETDEEIMNGYLPEMWDVDANEVKRLNENTFAKAFRDVNNLRYNNGLFYTRYGKATEEGLSKDVWESLEGQNINRNVESTVKKLIGAVKLASTVDALKVNDKHVPFRNGDLWLNRDGWKFLVDDYQPAPYRLRATLKFEAQDMPYFRKWLADLFEPEDIPTIQEYLGYCLVPTTKAQKALFLVGEGGAGKSVMGVILEAILGDAMLSVTNTQEFMQDKFKLPELEHKLVLYDDDLDSTALTGTGLYKKLITNNLAITADRKYGQPFKFTPYAKLVSCCNEMLTSMYDNTQGFYRRLLPVLIKPIAADFKADLSFYDKIRAEAPNILQWSLMGLNRLIDQNWVLSESERTKRYLRQKQSIGNHYPDFIHEVFDFGEGYSCTSADIVAIYSRWCRANACDARKPRALEAWMTDNAEKFRLKKSTNIPVGGKRLRGYFGMQVSNRWRTSSGKIQLN